MVFCNIKDIEGDFWEQNKQLSYMSPFSSFKKKKNSSKIMKAIYLIYDSKSSFKQTPMSEEEIIKDVNLNFLEDENFKWSEYEDIVEAFKDKCRTGTAKIIEGISEECNDIQLAIKDLSLSDPEEISMRKDLHTMRSKLLSEKIDLELKLKEEIGELLLEGDYSPSLIEATIINGMGESK